MTPWERAMQAPLDSVDMSRYVKPRCLCGHGPDDMCANGYVYTSCGAVSCDGACEPTLDCLYAPGCCEFENRKGRTKC